MNRDEWNQVLETEPATPNQRGAIMDHFRRLGFHPQRDRAERLATCAALLDLDALGSTAELTMGQAGRLVHILQRTPGRAELAAAAAAAADDRQALDDAAADYRDGDLAEPLTVAEAVGRIIILAYLTFGDRDRVRESGNVALNMQRLQATWLFPAQGRANSAD
jgi:hypothetical protein